MRAHYLPQQVAENIRDLALLPVSHLRPTDPLRDHKPMLLFILMGRLRPGGAKSPGPEFGGH